jgi:hypothetical protein
VSEQIYEVVEAWHIVYKNPIKLQKGEVVTIQKRESDPQWKGWIYCLDQVGVGGWVSEAYLDIDEHTAIVIRDYDATELEVLIGESIYGHYEEFGWIWAENSKGQNGWVPLRNLSLKNRKDNEIICE